MKKSFCSVIAVLAVIVWLCGSASAEQAGKDWYFSLRLGYQPYTVEADGIFGNRAFDKKADLSDIMDKTDTTILGGEVEFGMGRWFATLNTFYQKSEFDKAEDRGNEMFFKETGINPMFGYRVYEKSFGNEQALALDVMAGIFYVDLEMDLDTTGSGGHIYRSENINWVDPMIGGRVSYAFTKRFGMGLSGQIGGFGVGSELQYQAAANLKYRFTDWLAIFGGYKYWYFKYEDDGKLLSELTQKLHGPVIGLEFRF